MFFNVSKEIIKRTHVVPALISRDLSLKVKAKSENIARQLDSALMSLGFKMSKELMLHFSTITRTTSVEYASTILDSVKELIGDNFKHNVYFKSFPDNVPDTRDFWVEQIIKLFTTGTCNYGKYQHSYQAMLDAHEEFIPSNKDRVTILHLGETVDIEAQKLYISLAGSSIPLKDADRELLKKMAAFCSEGEQPEKIPVRENKAIINQVRLSDNKTLLVDTITDILRLACVISGGDETLVEKTKFLSSPRAIRKVFMQSLEDILAKSPYKLEDVVPYTERWKRLGEKLHPKEYQQFKKAQDVFAIARNDKKVVTFMGRVEKAFLEKNLKEALSLLGKKPGVLFRNIDRLLRLCDNNQNKILQILTTVQLVIPKVSTKVLLSLNEHIKNRISTRALDRRIFTNKKGSAWVTEETRKPLNTIGGSKLLVTFGEELINRLPKNLGTVLFDPTVKDVALPYSDKNNASGFSVMPKGSVTTVGDKDILRFFCYWKEAENRTDFDLSVLLLDDDFEVVSQVSYTRLDEDFIQHSGDITSAPNGATEFIDIELQKVKYKYIVPLVFIYSGEKFTEVEESFFGYMELNKDQKGKPFEPATVKMRSDVRGKGKVSIPAIFQKDSEGNWKANWIHLFLKGLPHFNRVEENYNTVNLIVKTFFNKQFTTVGDFLSMLENTEATVAVYDADIKYESPVTYIGLERPEGLPEGSTFYTLNNLHELVGLFG